MSSNVFFKKHTFHAESSFSGGYAQRLAIGLEGGSLFVQEFEQHEFMGESLSLEYGKHCRAKCRLHDTAETLDCGLFRAHCFASSGTTRLRSENFHSAQPKIVIAGSINTAASAASIMTDWLASNYLMPRFDVTIAGELNLDLILYGLPDKLEPERELLAERMMLTLGSSSAIVAHNLSALGSRVGFQSLIGDDQLGQIALERLQQGGVDVSRVRRTQGSTTTGLTIILQRTGWRNILTYAGTIAQFSLKDLDFDYLLDSRHFHLSSLYLHRALLPDMAELLRRVKRRPASPFRSTPMTTPKTVWDGGLKDLLKYVDVFLPNLREATRITGTDDPGVAIKRLAEMVPLVVAKLGTGGALAQRGTERFSSPALTIRPSTR